MSGSADDPSFRAGPAPLAPEVIDRVWAKLSVAYGHRFLSIWDGMPDEVVKADWAQTLAGVPEGAILYALQHLPAGRPPDAIQFREICNRRPPEPAQRALAHMPRKTGTPEFARELAERLRAKPSTGAAKSKRLHWAQGYIASHGGEGLALTAPQREWLARAREIVQLETADDQLAEKKAQAQAMTDARLEADRDDQ